MPTYSDAEMRAIMGRALQIDSGRSERFTPEQIRTIAGELGISTQALEVAMYEADSKGGGLNVQGQPAAARTPHWGRGVAIAGGALLVLMTMFAFMRLKPRPTSQPAPTPVAVDPVGPARAAPAVPIERAPEPTPVTKTKSTRKTATPRL